MTDRDDLIEKAAKAIYEHCETTDDGVTCMGCDERIDNDLAKHQARIALAVFEKSLTHDHSPSVSVSEVQASAPTDDEREALEQVVADFMQPSGYEVTESDRILADRIFAAGFRRPSPPEPEDECRQCGTPIVSDGSDGWDHQRPQRTLHVPFPAIRSQGEPSDVQVAAFKAEWHAAQAEGDDGNKVRRGLRAALAIKEP